MWVARVVDKLCPWVVQVACTTTLSSMSCSTPSASIMSRPALTGTTTSESCGKTLVRVSCLFVCFFYFPEQSQKWLMSIACNGKTCYLSILLLFFLPRHEVQFRKNQHSEPGNFLWLQLCHAISQVCTVGFDWLVYCCYCDARSIWAVSCEWILLCSVNYIQAKATQREQTTYCANS